jgi:hypothetical protein
MSRKKIDYGTEVAQAANQVGGWIRKKIPFRFLLLCGTNATYRKYGTQNYPKKKKVTTGGIVTY